MNGRDLSAGFLQTDDMRAADEEIRNSSPETEPDNWTFVNSMGWIYTGPRAKDNTATAKGNWINRKLGGPDHNARRQWATGALGWHRGGDILELAGEGEKGYGFGNFTKDSWDRLYGYADSNYHPLIDTNPNDHKEIMALYKSDSFNPYLDRSEMGSEVREGSVADVLYGIMRDPNQIRNRYKVYRALRGNMGGLGQRRMTQRQWNDYGLNDILGDYNSYVDNPLAGGNPLLRMEGANAGSGNGYLTGGTNRDTMSEIGNVGSDRGFLGAYKAKRQELETDKPSVRSLFKEMEEYENE